MNISFLPEHLFSLGGFPITNSLLVAWLAIAILIAFAYFSTRKMELIPKNKGQYLAEMVVGFLYDLVSGVTGDDKQTKKFFPLVATIFLFVLLSNWLGLLPGVGSMGFFEEVAGSEEKILVPLFRAGSADLNFTLGLAIISVFAIQFFGIAALGVFKYGKKFINFKSPISFVVGILELVGEVAKVISFSFRLFGNVFAGEVLLIVITFLVPYIVPLPFYFLEVVVGLIQAFIFSMLTVVFLKMAVTMEEGH